MVRDVAVGGLLRASTQGGILESPTTSGMEIGVSASYLGLVDPNGWGLRVGGQLGYLSASTRKSSCGGVLESCAVTSPSSRDAGGTVATVALQPSVHLGDGVRLGAQLELGYKMGASQTGEVQTATTSSGSSTQITTGAESYQTPGPGVRIVVGPTLDITF